MKNINILSIEISTELCSISIYYNKKIFSKYKYTKIKSSKYILILIKKLFKKINIKKNKINIIAINKGPGSIIGIRISSLISKIFKIKYKNIKILKIKSYKIISYNYFNKYKKNNIINILIYHNKKNIYNYIFKKNKKIKKKILSIKKIKKYIKNLNNKITILFNKYQTKKKFLYIIKKKKNKIIYPKSKYIILYIKNILFKKKKWKKIQYLK